jgi:hypothetical protein
VRKGTDVCAHGVMNWNAWVGSISALAVALLQPLRSLSEMQCTAGCRAGNFNGLCAFTCRYGYCPEGACVCTNMAAPREWSPALHVDGYPANGESNYAGL